MKFCILTTLLIAIPGAWPADDHFFRRNKDGEVVSVIIRGSNVADLDLQQYPKIETGFILDHKVTKIAVDCLLRAKTLKILEIGHAPEGIEIDSGLLTKVAGFTELEKAWLCKKNLSDSDLEVFVALKKLRTLYIEGRNLIDGHVHEKHGLTDKAAQILKRMPSLETLTILGEAEFTDDFIHELASIKTLAVIALRSDKLTDASLLTFAKVKKLPPEGIGQV